jgi:methylglutamate dehydrogenase subunit D
MAEFALKARTGFAGLAIPGRCGTRQTGEPALVIVERPNWAILQLSAFHAKEDAVAKAVASETGLDLPAGPKRTAAKDVALIGVAPSQWLAVAEGEKGRALLARLVASLSGLASVVDQSHAKAILGLRGSRAREVLAKGCSLDLHRSAFTPQDAATTQVALIPCQIWMLDETPTFELSVPLSYAESFWSWLGESAAEFGYEVKPALEAG